jgi:hypothetical protein
MDFCLWLGGLALSFDLACYQDRLLLGVMHTLCLLKGFGAEDVENNGGGVTWRRDAFPHV